jgi:hypothetical protein
MSGLRIIPAAEWQCKPHGFSVVLAGHSGIGKTWQVGTLPNLDRVLIIDADRGTLPLFKSNTSVDIVQPDGGWLDFADLFALIGGPNPSLPSTSLYSEEHFRKVSGLIDVSRYDTFIFDSISQIGRESFRWAETHPEFSPRGGGRDSRAAYLQHSRQMIAGLQQVQRGAPNKIVIFIAVLERLVDDFGRAEWRIQLEGEKTGRELPSIVDEILTLSWVTAKDGKKFRAIICHQDNQWNYPAKDRSGKLGLIEEPNLGKLLAKLATRQPTTGA